MKKDSSKLPLLDVNVLIALAWTIHPFHASAKQQMGSRREAWATCALPQLGFIRLSSTAAANPSPNTPSEAAAILALMTQSRHAAHL